MLFLIFRGLAMGVVSMQQLVWSQGVWQWVWCTSCVLVGVVILAIIMCGGREGGGEDVIVLVWVCGVM